MYFLDWLVGVHLDLVRNARLVGRIPPKMNSTGAPLGTEVDCELSAFEGVDGVPAVDCVLPDSEGGLLLHAEKSVAARINAIYVFMMTSPFRADVSKLNASTDSHLTLRSKVTGIATRHS